MSDTVAVTVQKYHTLHGKEHQPGDTYAAPAELVPSLVAQGLVAAPVVPAAPVKLSKPVEPMMLDALTSMAKARAPKAAKVSKPAERRTVTKPLRKAKIRGKR